MPDTSYFDYLIDKRLGSKISSISMMFGFIGFLLKDRMVDDLGNCNLVILGGYDQSLVCYLFLIGPFLIGFSVGTFVMFLSINGARCNESGLIHLFQKTADKKRLSTEEGVSNSHYTKLVLLFGLFVLMVSPFALYLVVQPGTYLQSDRNVFPIITLAIMAAVYGELFFAMIFCSRKKRRRNTEET